MRIFHAVVHVGLLIALGLTLRSCSEQAKLRQEAADKNAVLELDKKALQVEIDATQKKIRAAEIDIDAANEQHDKDTARIAAFRKRPSTPAVINSAKPPELGNVAVENCGPEQKPQLVIAGDVQQNEDALHKWEADSQQCRADMVACARKLSDREAQFRASQVQLDKTRKQLADTTQQRDNFDAALKGGPVWHRIGKGLKVDAAGVGGAVLGAALDHKHPWRGAGIGAAAGTVSIQIFGK